MATLIRRGLWWARSIKFAATSHLNTFLYKIRGGFRCSCCGVIIPTAGHTITSTAPFGKRFIFQSYHSKPRCATCTMEKISAYFSRAPILEADYSLGRCGLEWAECDWSHRRALCIDSIFKFNNDLAQELDLDIRFGSSWWNGHKISEYALESCIMQGEYGPYYFFDASDSLQDVGLGVKVDLRSKDLRV